MGDCDREIFDKGVSLLAIDGWAKDIEPWVKKVAVRSGQRVDWHYSGGIAHVLVLGDFNRAMAAVNELESELLSVPVPEDHPRFREYQGRNPPLILRRFGLGDRGLYRAGDPLPGDVVAIDCASVAIERGEPEARRDRDG